ncbi:DEAD/DEAH box helicase domain protein [Arcobacter nitrofigilis DSM 7299]|uniref:DEAD-box ATP-dependent RNA helicase RhpA n=1 Tax=Arcobacter nitrofigilis (strain ATCC 33309 / DSM 7299 / CCUG 15893 / LMG 7604 / NCTC 12251 / CI) TaxID=572480 RepID=D5V1C8_ARCNC|nr:DEAD/DEAH box helicase [Arcobacter nitrofigilis]ADG94090.1 DEAD/DEAH box helicase domain protein [Arcobacter nitrofigilis DSM 7299]
MTFKELGLIEPLLKAIKDKGYIKPSPIQEQAIPIILEKHDVLAGAQTGTGKTAGFTLPLLQILSKKESNNTKPEIRALILTPTRELAAQVAQSVDDYGKYLPLKTAVIFGGVGINPQKALIRKGVDIVIATPGRLLDHIEQKTIDISHVEHFILDEADRMLDMGFIRDIRKVLALLPSHRQNLLFSATFSDEIKKLSDGILNKPKLIEVARRNTSSEMVSQVIHLVDKDRKKTLLSKLIKEGDWRQVLVFTRTKHGANKLSQQLEIDGITATAIHGNKSQGARTKALADFKAGAVRVLVATDIAARGIDIDQLPHVVNFELPNVAEDYVHRIGRTGRAGNEGQAVSLVCVDEHDYLKGIEKLIKTSIKKVLIEGFEVDPSIKAEPISNGRNKGRNNSNSRNTPKKEFSSEKNRRRDKKPFRNSDESKRSEKSSSPKGKLSNEGKKFKESSSNSKFASSKPSQSRTDNRSNRQRRPRVQKD